MKTKIIFMIFAFLLTIVLLNSGVLAVASSSAVPATPTVCCETTKTGLYCQDVPASQCDTSSQSPAPTSCRSTSYCKLGTCYDSKQGICLPNSPKKTCNANGGVWSETSPSQCALGCCILGDQAAFVTLVRCKKLSAELGLITNYKKNIQDEATCVMVVKNQDRGACVYDSDFERTCKMTTRADCGIANETLGKAEFFAGKLCSAPSLGTNCGPTQKTTCIDGKEGVYFLDSCGNPANIYDENKLIDTLYWTNIVDSAQSCSLDSQGYKKCGNCDYLAGTICRAKTKDRSADIGDSACFDLNCPSTVTSDHQDHLHGESWCINEDPVGVGNNKVGSESFRHICINGQDVLEACKGQRAEMCVQDSISYTDSKGESRTFSQAGCRVNKWQFCTVQDNQDDCENPNNGDCLWIAGGSVYSLGNSTTGACVPKNSPGLNFWTTGDAKPVCAQASFTCTVKYEKDIIQVIGGSEGKCVENCGCIDGTWLASRKGICQALGDCGPKVNWLDIVTQKTPGTPPAGLAIFESGNGYTFSVSA